MRRLIPILLLPLLLASCGQQATPAATTALSAARLPTLVPTTIPPTFLPGTTMTPPPPSPIPTESESPVSSPGAPQEGYQIDDLNMVDAQVGWAVFVRGHFSDGQYWLGRTTDGGHTWINVTPPAFKAIREPKTAKLFPLGFSTRYTYLRVDALDHEKAWVNLTCAVSTENCDVPSVIWRTEDGGRSWQTLPVPVDCRVWRIGCLPTSLQFVDHQHGWMHMSLFGRNYLDYAFYRTIDGGETWELLPKFELASGGANFLFDPIFVDADFGWKLAPSYRSASSAEIKTKGLSWSEITRDGGYTWHMVNLPLAPGMIEALTALGMPDTQPIEVNYSFSSMDSGAVSIFVNLNLDDEISPFFSAYYFSSDQGRSWRALSRVGDTYFHNEESGWRLADMNTMALQETNDGGATWLAYPVEAVNLEKNSGVRTLVHTTEGGTNRTEIQWVFIDDELWPGQGLRLESLHMETALTGWGLEAGGTTVCTSDGAESWQPCGPQDKWTIPTEAEMPETKANWLPSQPLPHELFHGGDVPSRLQTEIDHGRQFEIYVNPAYDYSPFRYRCVSQAVDQLGSEMLGVARECAIIYPIKDHQDYGFEEGYWLYHYYVLFDDGLSQIWSNVVSMDFVEEQIGWRLLDLQNGFFRLEETDDGGDTWTEVKTVAWTGELELVNADEAWSIARVPAIRGVPTYQYTPDLFREAVLLHTTDGGQTWQEILPVMRP